MKHPIITALILYSWGLSSAQTPDVSRITVTAQNPVSKTDTATRKALIEYWNECQQLPAKKVKAQPSAEIFPGMVKEGTPRIKRNVDIIHAPIADSISHIVENLHYSGRYSDIMYSTGLYAPAGEVIKVTVPKSLAGRKINIQIGCHTDRLDYWEASKSDWRRLPLLSVKKEIDKTVTTIASPAGGLVYITCSPKDEAFAGTFEIEGAVASPHFVLHTTTDEQWSDMLAQSGAPWGEIEAGSIILSLPTEQLRELVNPNAKIAMWDQIVGACYDLAQIPTPFYRKQRIVADVQISGGYMHSGYPIMANATACGTLCDPERLLKESGWGFFHEIGHNMQNAVDWVFAGSTEVSVNLFTLYVFDKVIMGRDKAHFNISQEYTKPRIEKYFAGGADFEIWKKDPFLGLITLRQIQEDFGWEIFKKTFRRFQQENRQMTREKRKGSREQADQRKIDNFVTYLSDAAERDLAPFFKLWGFPVSEQAAQKTEIYPVWIPYNFPPCK